jgi:predicted NAD/FAD-dependent oxidoreductase
MIDVREKHTDFLVVGAGLAGLAFARDMQARGATVRVLDKGRGVGGRAATRRWSDVRVDYGAQYFTARGARLSALVHEGLTLKWLSVWCHGFPKWEDGRIQEREPGHPRYAPPAGMSELPKRLAAGLDIHTGAQVRRVDRNGDGKYRAACEDGRTFTGDTLILNLPPVPLLTISRDLLPPDTADAIGQVEFLPAWVLLLRLEEDVPGADWPAIEFSGHPILGWVARDHMRRGLDAPPVLVVHASGGWSAAHLEEDPLSVQAALLYAVEEAVGPLSVRDVQVHRWQYALPTRVFPAPCFWDGERRIGFCGDWCDGPKIEGALESGWRLAERIA